MKLITTLLIGAVAGKSLVTPLDESTIPVPLDPTSPAPVKTVDAIVEPVKTVDTVPADSGKKVPIERQVSPIEAIVDKAAEAAKAIAAAKEEAERKKKEAEEKARMEAEKKAAEEAAAYAEVIRQRWETVENVNYYSRQIWLGMFTGFYGMSMKAIKPTDDCFGPWVTESTHELVNFGWDLTNNWRNVTFAESETAAYDVVDLIFRNDEYCHFRNTYWELYDFCQLDGNCEDIWTNVQTNAFSIITQLTASLAAMKAKPWGELAKEQKGFVLNTMGKSVGQIISDLIGFSSF